MQIASCTKNKYVTILLFVLGALIFSYTLIRAHLISITWDEAFSYMNFVRHKIVIPEKSGIMDANNHLLNTWLSIYLTEYFGLSEFVLRIPSLTAHLLFIFFSYRLVKEFENQLLTIVSFLIINLNPYLLDFFSLSRGYGLSIGLMMSSVYYLYVFISKGYKKKDALLVTIFGALAASANFVALNYFLVSFGLIILLMINNIIQSDKNTKEKWIQFIRTSLLPALIFIVSLWIMIPVALQLKNIGALFYGGNNGFWKDTVTTITDRCFYELGYNYLFQQFAKGFVIFILIGATAFVFIKYVKKKFANNHLFLFALLSLIALTALSTIVQNKLLDTLYLIDRTSLFFVLLFNLTFVFFMNEWSKSSSWATVFTYFTGFIVLFHFVSSVNFTYVLEWKSNADVKQMIEDLEKIKTIPEEKKNVNMCVPLSYSLPINFYRAVANKTWINVVEPSKNVNMNYNYLYISPEQSKTINFDSIEIIKTYPITNSILARPKYKPRHTKVNLKQVLDFEKFPEGKYVVGQEVEYGQGFNYIINDTLTPIKDAEVIIKATVLAPEISVLNFGMICSLENERGSYFWKMACIKDYIVKAHVWAEVNYSCLIPHEARHGDLLKVYIWNINKSELHVKNEKLKWVNYKY